MTRIMPVGSSSSWAQDNKENTIDPMLAAAQEFMKKKAGIIPGVPDGTGPHGNGPGCQCTEVLQEVAPEVSSEVIPEAISEAIPAEVSKEEKPASTSDVSEVKEVVKEAVEEVKEVLDNVEQKLEEVSCEEVEIEIEDEKDGEPKEIEIEIEDEKDEKDEKKDENEDIIVESAPASTCASSDKKVEKKAAVAEEFLRFSSISPNNRMKLKKYWKEDLGFPADYVALLVKDYEK